MNGKQTAESIELRRIWYFPVIITLAALGVYANHFDGVFLLDDLSNIVENSTLRLVGGLASNWKELLDQGRPLAFLSFIIDFKIWGLNPVGYHIGNLAIHLLASLVAFGLLRTTLTKSAVIPANIQSNGNFLAFAIALLWTVHPLNTQSVTYIVQRIESLMGLFLLVSVFAAAKAFSQYSDRVYIRRSIIWQWISVVSAILSVATKQVGAVIPLVILSSHWLFWSGKNPSDFRKSLVAHKTLYIGMLGFCLVTLLLQALPQLNTDSAFHFRDISPIEYLLSQPEIILHYVVISFWPRTLVLDYGWPVAQGFAAIAIPLLIVSTLVIATIYGIAKRKIYSFLGVWFFVILAPSSSFLPVKDLAFEHRMYLPLLALLTGATVFFWTALNRLKMTNWFYVVIAVAVSLLGLRTHFRNYDYRSAITMWSGVLEARPKNPRALNELGNALLQSGKQNEAIQLFQQALVLEPKNPGPLLNISNIFQSAGQIDQALAAVTRAIELKPEFASAHFNIGNIYLAKNDLAKAEDSYMTALKHESAYAEAYVGLGNTFAMAQNYDKAMEQYHKALSIKPWLSQPYNNIGTIYSKLGKHEEAVKNYFEALNRNPADVGIRINMANTLAEMGNLEKAKEHYFIALSIAPENQVALAALKRMTDKADAVPLVEPKDSSKN